MAPRAFLLATLFLAGCSCEPAPGNDGGVDAAVEEDAGAMDAGRDAGAVDSGMPDAGVDAGAPDAGPPDAGLSDGGCVYRLDPRPGLWMTARPLAMELADLNADNQLDFIVATTSALEVRLNDGQGGFMMQSLLAPITAQTLVVQDLDADGRLDVLAVDSAGVLTVLTGNGDGTFTLGTRLDAGGPLFVPLDTALADLDLDGLADFVTLDVGGAVPELRSVRGTFDAGPPRVTNGSHRLQLSDVTGDGLIDALVGNAQYGLAVHAGDGDGGFGVPTVHLGSTAVNSVALADVTGDGVNDAVCATGYYDVSSGLTTGAGVSVLPGRDGGFAAPTGSASGRDIIWALVLADLNRDNVLDAVTTRLAFDGGVEVLAGDAGSFSALLRVPGRNGWALAVGDLNEDGWPDVAVGTGAGSNGEVKVLLGSCQ